MRKQQLLRQLYSSPKIFHLIHTQQRIVSKAFSTILEADDLILNMLQHDFKNFKIQYPTSNVTESVANKLARRLHLLPNHPLNILKTRIEIYCCNHAQTNGRSQFRIFDDRNPVVNIKNCFDDLLVGKDHVSRQSSDTYYIDSDKLLRTHTSAHQTTLISQHLDAFLCSGDVYRRDEIDSTHYPVFHQMEGVRIFNKRELLASSGVQVDPSNPEKLDEECSRLVSRDLQELLTGLALSLFGADCELRWREDYFPFTRPSFELEVLFNGQWLEVLGCGVIHSQVLRNAGLDPEQSSGWAFGLGLERLAMVLFQIPDIRLFWSTDERFLQQFDGRSPLSRFVPYSKFPACYKDVSFWLPSHGLQDGSSGFHVNDMYEVIREAAGDLVEKVQLFDQYRNEATGRTSHAYRILYRHMDRSLTNKEVDDVQWEVRRLLVEKLGVTLR